MIRKPSHVLVAPRAATTTPEPQAKTAPSPARRATAPRRPVEHMPEPCPLSAPELRRLVLDTLG